MNNKPYQHAMNERGVALVMVLMLSLIGLAIVSALLKSCPITSKTGVC